MTLEPKSSETLWANKHRRMADVYSLHFFLILPTLMGFMGNFLLAFVALFIVVAVYLFIPMPFIGRFKAAFTSFEKGFWTVQLLGVLAVVLLIIFPHWRSALGLGWGIIGFVFTYPMMRQMKFK